MDFWKVYETRQESIDRALEGYFRVNLKKLPYFKNPVIKEHYQLLADYCLRRAKRLRPVLTLLAYQAAGGKNIKSILEPALAFELFHNYTLIHDDIYDEDEKRRGEWANHILFQKRFQKMYGSAGSAKLYSSESERFGVVAGMINGKILHILSLRAILFSKISERMKLAGTELLKEVSLIDNLGQAIDLDFEKEKRVSPEDYRTMVLCKTGQLFSSAAQWGAVLAGASQSQRQALRRYAEYLSITFQIRDDLLDINLDGKKGRDIGSDIKKGKKTLLVIDALQKAGPKEKKLILTNLGNPKAAEPQIKKIIDLLHSLGSVERARQEAFLQMEKGIEALEEARPSFREPHKRHLRALAEYMFNRQK